MSEVAPRENEWSVVAPRTKKGDLDVLRGAVSE